jgi:hypothetical protein
MTTIKKPPPEPVATAGARQKIRITLTSRNVKSLEKGIFHSHSTSFCMMYFCNSIRVFTNFLNFSSLPRINQKIERKNRKTN